MKMIVTCWFEIIWDRDWDFGIQILIDWKWYLSRPILEYDSNEDETEFNVDERNWTLSLESE